MACPLCNTTPTLVLADLVSEALFSNASSYVFRLLFCSHSVPPV